MRTSRVITIIMFMILPTLACGLLDEIIEPQATFSPPPTPGGLAPTVTSEAGLDPTADGAVATPTLAVSPTPGAPSLEELGDPPETVAELKTWVANAQNAGAGLNDLCALLAGAGWQQAGDTCQSADLDGTDPEEWLLTIDFTNMRPDSPPLLNEGHPGDFWIVSDGLVVYQTREDEDPDLFASAPTLVELVDMSGDDQPEVVTVSHACGAHTCTYFYQILGAHDGPIRNLVEHAADRLATGEELPEFISLATIQEEALEDATGDDLPDLVITGGLVGSAGAGIQRARTEVWAWSGEAITLEEQEWEETDYRFHWLYNANDAFDDEEYDLARTRYEAVIVDPNLEDVEGPLGSAQEVRDHARQFAGFRLTLLPLLRGDITESTRWRNWLSEEYPDAPITEAAARLFSEWESNGNNLAAACTTVTNYLQGTDNPTGPLTDMGYNNPSLTAETVCPLE